jgi:hypothetical protein
MGLFQRLRDSFKQDKKRAAIAGGLAGTLGLITITATQIASPEEEGGIPVPADFPTYTSVGPAVDPTDPYLGDCYMDSSDTGLVIDAKVIDCTGAAGLRIAQGATGIVITDSILLGGFATLGNVPGDVGGYQEEYPKTPTITFEDSKIIHDRAACCGHFVIRRSLLQGSHSSLLGHNSTVIEDNYITTDGTSTHQSGVRILKNSILRGNTISCKPTGDAELGDPYDPYDDSGCSAHGVFYREDIGGTGTPAYNLVIDNNYFKRGVNDINGLEGGPYVATRFVDCDSWTDCINITFTGNLFSLNEGTDAGEFPEGSAGNVWSGNYWTDGTTAESGEAN